MKHFFDTVLRGAVAALGVTALAACDNSSNAVAVVPPISDNSYQAEIVWTEYGIPHITAGDWGSLGYGYGYAYSRENFCVLMKEVIRSNGDSARYLGDEGNLQEDFVYKLYNTDEYIRENYTENPGPGALIKGFTAGVNRYLEETGVDKLAEGEEGCRGEEWVRPLNDTDLGKVLRKLMLYASTQPLAEYISAQDGPDEPMVVQARLKRQQELLPALVDGLQIAASDIRELLPKPEQFGSNAYAVGSNASIKGPGLLLGNPHFPWQGPNRLNMVHLTIPGVYDVMGAALHGSPLVNIGFNRDIAWSHTVSTSKRFTLYEITLDASDPMKYVYGGELRDIETKTVNAERVLPNGEIESVEHTFYLTHYGPVVDLSGPTGVDLLGDWPTLLGTVYALRDVNLYNDRFFDLFSGMGMAGNLQELLAATRNMGNPWTNTIAADRQGNAFYGDISTTPHVTRAQYESCISGFVAPDLTDNGLVTLDGSDPDCEWGSDDDAPVDGVFGYDSMPKIETRDYAANANDSYWLANPDHLLTGFPYIIGREEVPQSIRTRHTFEQAEMRIAGTDGLGAPGFDIDNIRQFHARSSNHAATLVVDGVVDICSAVSDWSSYSDNAAAVAQACEVLADWDGTHRVDSVGGHVFFEFWRVARRINNLWAVPFDPADPVHTPRELNTADSAVVEAVKESLATGVDVLVAAGIPMDRPWGEVQFDEKNGERIGIHGGSGAMMFSVITSDLVQGEGYSAIEHGNSYMQAVTWDESDCPDAYAILTYSQSTDPASDHYADATKLYSSGGWIDMPYCEAERDAQEIRRMTIEGTAE